MISILIAWIVIFIVLYSFGQIALTLCYRLFKKKNNIDAQSYNTFDILLMGICAVVLPLQFWSLVFPSNQVFLALCLVISITFLLFNKEIVKKEVCQLKNAIKILSWTQLAILLLFVLIAFWGALWIEGNFDSEYYHYPAIRWNEEYPVVPGLANLEDRFAFNSTYFLLSAIFSFQFLWQEPIYALQSFIFIGFILWVFFSLFTSKREVKHILLFICTLLFSTLYVTKLVNTSTDILPNLIFFYLVANICLFPDNILKKKYLFFVLPFLIVTLKISLAPIGIFSLYLFYLLWQQKQLRGASVLLFASSLIVVLWLVRNVILSGYLVYPVYEIDLFSFDWKLPQEVAILQKKYIYDYPISVWKETLDAPLLRISRPVWSNLLALLSVGFFIVSLVFLIIHTTKLALQKQLNTALLLVGTASLLTVVLGISNGFDLRFISGALLAIILLGGIAFCNLLKIKKANWLKFPLILLFFLTYGVWTASFARDRFSAVNENYKSTKERHVSSILLTPYPTHDYMSIMGYVSLDSVITIDKIDNKFDIYVANIVYGMNKFPLTYRVGEAHHGKLVDYHCLKARGETLNQGFRMDTTCMHQNIESVKEALKAKGY